jgi:hypothetical protein
MLAVIAMIVPCAGYLFPTYTNARAAGSKPAAPVLGQSFLECRNRVTEVGHRLFFGH